MFLSKVRPFDPLIDIVNQPWRGFKSPKYQLPSADGAGTPASICACGTKATSPALRAPSPEGRDPLRIPRHLIKKGALGHESLPSGEGARRAGEVS